MGDSPALPRKAPRRVTARASKGSPVLQSASGGQREESFLRRNGLSTAVLLMMIVAWAAQALTGHAAHNQELAEHGKAAMPLFAYLGGADFWSATFENWESEFLQMGVYVLLTVWLRQKGSAESRPMEESDEIDDPTPESLQPEAWRKGGVIRWLYANSLSLAFLLLFLASFAGHLVGSWHKSLGEATLHQQPAETLTQYLADPSFWFESFQNWQSEFLAVLSIIVLSIFLRQKDSPQSKKVDEPHSKTGT
jgi:hypothetical protein